MHSDSGRLRISLLLLRITVFMVMAMWSLDKLLMPGHAAAVFGNFYGFPDIGAGLLLAIGLVQLAVEIAFVLGLWRLWTYGYVLIAHGISTLSSWRQYLDPFDNLLFFAAIPMLGACIALFLMRDDDTLLTIGGR
ncbi:hypothetical protein [Halofilum ochraceum]|uniref:hypothetical protein n=1 Tax=Halofilum ochraceum TaxID=1611323 RepID=UPI0008D904AF|nr:hypothetical protein [Halofilum ochraceum]